MQLNEHDDGDGVLFSHFIHHAHDCMVHPCAAVSFRPRGWQFCCLRLFLLLLLLLSTHHFIAVTVAVAGQLVLQHLQWWCCRLRRCRCRGILRRAGGVAARVAVVVVAAVAGRTCSRHGRDAALVPGWRRGPFVPPPPPPSPFATPATSTRACGAAPSSSTGSTSASRSTRPFVLDVAVCARTTTADIAFQAAMSTVLRLLLLVLLLSAARAALAALVRAVAAAAGDAWTPQWILGRGRRGTSIASSGIGGGADAGSTSSR
mmetsp:Transcript_28790/g.48324  ORF Transcript_28790/g.48324 Transcript_28790/m.48324 type:complete len:261 (+) Transcript_28790:1228-2010(+)